MKCITYNQAEQIFDAAKNYNKDTYASIENFKSVGDNSTPVYFDENGVPKPIKDSLTVIDGFELDVNGGIMAIEDFTESVQFELDENGDIMPKEVPG